MKKSIYNLSSIYRINNTEKILINGGLRKNGEVGNEGNKGNPKGQDVFNPDGEGRY